MFETRLPQQDHYSVPLRRHLLLAIVIFLWIMLIDNELLFLYLFVGVPGVLVVAILASVTEPHNNNYIIIADMIVSAVLFLLFEYFAIAAYQQVGTIWDMVFLLRQVMAIVLLSSFYVALRDIREYKIQKRNQLRNFNEYNI